MYVACRVGLTGSNVRLFLGMVCIVQLCDTIAISSVLVYEFGMLSLLHGLFEPVPFQRALPALLFGLASALYLSASEVALIRICSYEAARHAIVIKLGLTGDPVVCRRAGVGRSAYRWSALQLRWSLIALTLCASSVLVGWKDDRDLRSDRRHVAVRQAASTRGETRGLADDDWFGSVPVLRCYDGDTCTVRLANDHRALPAIFHTMSVRVKGIDTPEIRGACPEEIRRALLAKHAATAFVVGKQVMLTDVKEDKYFRLVANMVTDEGDLAEHLLELGHAIRYDGGRKDRNWCAAPPGVLPGGGAGPG